MERPMADSGRMPDVVIIGAMKFASTSRYRWLDSQPEVYMAHPKETNFFSDAWERGPAWYRSQFAGAGERQLCGEASVNYTSPEWSDVAASRMHDLIPNARLIYVV